MTSALANDVDGGQPAVECTRGQGREAVHPFSAVMVEGRKVQWRVGPDVATFWRSASKPFQLRTSLSCLLPSVVATLTDQELAIGAASHSGQIEHVALVESLLSRFRLSANALQCGAHLPMHEPSARAVKDMTVLHNNCSGKHTFMLAACSAQGWPLDYRPLVHPLQQRNQQYLDTLGETTHDSAMDGCSVPTFFASLSSMAKSWSRLAESMAGEGDALLGRIGEAMHRAPFFASGSERLDLAVVQQAAEPLAVKIGAEGLFCIARPARRQGIAVKVHSGNADALAVAVRHVLGVLGVTLSGEWPWATVKNVREVEVGTRRVV
jgi:L-asparaginase II